LVVLMRKAAKIVIGATAVGVFFLLLKRVIEKQGRQIDTEAIEKDLGKSVVPGREYNE
jgi:hypothetical protein